MAEGIIDMIRIAVIPPIADLAGIIRCLRRHTALPIRVLRERLAGGLPVIDLPFDGDTVIQVRRCRSLLRDLDAVGAKLRIWELYNNGCEAEVTREFLRNLMRLQIDISKQVRRDMDREAERG
jgi:hypothetical protein